MHLEGMPTLHTSDKRGSDIDLYSNREREVISGLSAGNSVKEIAAQLNLTVNMVKDYLKTIYAKAHVHSARELLVHLYGVPHFGKADVDGMHLLGAIEGLLSAAHQQELLRRLSEGIRMCGHAGRLGLWRRATPPTGECLVPLAGGENRPLAPARMFADAIEYGQAHFRAASESERLDLAALGLDASALATILPVPTGANLGARRALPRGETLILASKAGADFTSVEAATIQLLARLAAAQCGGRIRSAATQVSTPAVRY